MLNEKRVKHMVRLSLYDKKNGEEDLKISSYYKKDYITFHVLSSLIWFTIAYGSFVLLLFFAFAETIMASVSFQTLWLLALGIFALYLLLLGGYLVMATKFYQREHRKAHFRMQSYKKNLLRLEEMYEKEDIHG